MRFLATCCCVLVSAARSQEGDRPPVPEVNPGVSGAWLYPAKVRIVLPCTSKHHNQNDFPSDYILHFRALQVLANSLKSAFTDSMSRGRLILPGCSVAMLYGAQVGCGTYLLYVLLPPSSFITTSKQYCVLSHDTCCAVDNAGVRIGFCIRMADETKCAEQISTLGLVVQ